MKLQSAIIQNVVNALAAKTAKKIVVIESDDWGAVRMPSKETYEALLSKQVISSADPFAKFDCLEREDDLIGLFEVLTSVQDSQGQAAKLTANCIMANPDFAKIHEANFEAYYFEFVADTFANHPKHGDSLGLWHEGERKNIFIPQLHGREHVNVGLWLAALQDKDNAFLEAFAHQTYAINTPVAAALGWSKKKEVHNLAESVRQGALMFEALFGKPSASFIAPNYTWDSTIEDALYESGIMCLQGSKKQNIPAFDTPNIHQRYHYLGQKNKRRQMYLVRNCLFEPSVSDKVDYLNLCLSQIKNAFFWNTPAVICSHRLNFVGHIDTANRDRNLLLLQQLLKSIVKYWPDVVFMSTVDLLGELHQSKNSGLQS